MRILDLTSFYPPHHGGVELFASELHDALLRMTSDIRVDVVTSRLGAADQLDETSHEGRLRVFRYAAREPVTSMSVPHLGALRRAVRNAGTRYDVVLSHTRFYPASARAGGIARSTGARWVHIEHGATSVQAGGAAVRFVADTVDRTIGRRTLRRADAVVAISDAVADFVHELAGVDATVLRRGIDIGEHVWQRDDSGPIVFVGRLVDAKGVGELLDAYADLDAATAPRLVLVGAGPERARLENQARLIGVAERIDFCGALERERVHELMTTASVFVNPSHTEGLPTTVLEAAAIGVPVIATDVGGTSEIVAHEYSGLLVPVRDAQALTDALRRVADPSGFAAGLGDRARRDVAVRFNWTETARGILDLAGGSAQDR